MATKIQQIMKLVPQNAVLFSPWLTAQGMDTKSQNAYCNQRTDYLCIDRSIAAVSQ